MAQIAQIAQGGVILNPPLNKNRRWCFTLNNYTAEEIAHIKTYFDKDKYVIGEEICPTTGTPHLQGYFNVKNAISFATVKRILPRANIRQCNGNEKSNFIYCTKESITHGRRYHTNIKGINIPKKIKDPIEGLQLYGWQKEVLNRSKIEPDNRSIFWWWEKDGCTGKTTICKHLMLTHKSCIIVAGKQNDMFCSIVKYHEEHGDYPELILIDIPRNNIKYVSYGGIEKIKDGLFFSGKYESSAVIMNCPNVFCFSNAEPDYYEMSKDRWRVRNISK